MAVEEAGASAGITTILLSVVPGNDESWRSTTQRGRQEGRESDNGTATAPPVPGSKSIATKGSQQTDRDAATGACLSSAQRGWFGRIQQHVKMKV